MFLITQYMKGAHSIKRNIVHRAPAVLVKNMTYLLVNIFVMDLTLKTIKQNRKKFPEMGLPTVSLLFPGTHMNNPDL